MRTSGTRRIHHSVFTLNQIIHCSWYDDSLLFSIYFLLFMFEHLKYDLKTSNLHILLQQRLPMFLWLKISFLMQKWRIKVSAGRRKLIFSEKNSQGHNLVSDNISRNSSCVLQINYRKVSSCYSIFLLQRSK